MSELIAGKNFPWEYIAGFYLRLHSFMPFAKVSGDEIGPAMLGAYGLAKAELPNPDVQPDQRIITLPIEDKSDFKSLFRAHLDANVREGLTELVVMFENRKGFFGGRKPSFHVAAYPTGTWRGFFDAVANSTPDQFRWPKALFLYQPSSITTFPASRAPLETSFPQATLSLSTIVSHKKGDEALPQDRTGRRIVLRH